MKNIEYRIEHGRKYIINKTKIIASVKLFKTIPPIIDIYEKYIPTYQVYTKGNHLMRITTQIKL